MSAPPPAPDGEGGAGGEPVVLASRWRRLGAATVDDGLAFLAAVLTSVLILLAGATSTTAGYAAIAGFAVFAVVNHVFIAAATDGQTLGKKLAGIWVEPETGGAYGLRTALVREVVGRVVTVIPLMALIDCLLILRESRRSLRDDLASTVVAQGPVSRLRGALLAASAVALVGVGIAAVAAGSDTPSDYSAIDRAAFVRGCSDHSAAGDSQCGCAFDRIRERLPYERFEQAERLPRERWSPSVSSAIVDAFAACMPQDAPPVPAGAGDGPPARPA